MTPSKMARVLIINHFLHLVLREFLVLASRARDDLTAEGEARRVGVRCCAPLERVSRKRLEINPKTGKVDAYPKDCAM
jgi:hypothetical protein